ncbi:MAG TPA: hypothetical protein VGJ45_35820 [Pseudonocardiaceae bacterium]
MVEHQTCRAHRDAPGNVADNQQFTADAGNVAARCTAKRRGYRTGTGGRAHHPRFAPESLTHNAGIADLGRANAVDVHLTGDHLRVLNEMPAQVRSRY